MKKLLSCLLAMALALTLLAGCSADEPASGAQPAATPAPTPTPEPYTPEVLTGLKQGEDYPTNQRFACVMVNNISDSAYQNARPQDGLSDADILVEIKVEGNITRFMAMYQDYTKIPQIAPVRSGRDQFFQLIIPFHPLYIHIGESVIQTQYKNNYDYEDFDINFDHTGFDRDQSRGNVASEHKAYTNAEHLADAIERLGTDTEMTYNSTFFNFVPYDEPARVLAGPSAAHIQVTHSDRYKTYFDWDEAAGKYMMSQYSHATGSIAPSVDRNNNQQLAFDNVLVIMTEFDVWPDPGDSGYDLQKVTYGSGYGYYFSGGRAEKVCWEKPTPDSALRILYAFGEEEQVQFNTGKTYIAVVDLEEAEGFTFEPDESEVASSASGADAGSAAAESTAAQ